MATQAARGFTIIEVMLFLAVTGLLAIGVFAGSSATIAQQRYRDSVNTLKGFIQEQYSQTTNVIDSEKSNPLCTAQGPSLILDDGILQPRGTSECLRLGRYLLIEPTQVTARDVIGQPTGVGGDSDVEVLKNYTFRTDDKFNSKEVAWGAMIVEPKSTTGLTASVLIVRSPLSGSVLTFVRDGTYSPSAMIDSAYMVKKDLCVDPQDGVTTTRRLAVRINARATSQSSIEIPLEKDSVCD